MDLATFKEIRKSKDLADNLHWLILSHESYLRESHEKWESLKHASLLNDAEGYRKAVEYNFTEAESMRERAEWLYEYIIERYGDKNE